MTHDLVVAGGLVVNADGRRHAHVLMDGGTITAVVDGSERPPKARRSIDATGLVVVPGGVDGHCHVAQVTGRYRTVDDYATSSVAALWGGTTTILDFGIPRDSSETPLEAALAKFELLKQSRCDVGLHGSVIDWDDSVPSQLEDLAARGIRSVKLYMTNRGSTMADESTVLKVMREMVRLDGLTYVHAEHDAMTVLCTSEHAARGEIGIQHLPVTRPEIVEDTSVAEVIAMSELTGAPVYFVHQTTPGAVGLAAEARRRGLSIHSETCPHYLLLDDQCYSGPTPHWYACCPPIRSRETVEALRTLYASGDVETVSSDHSCYDLSQKLEHADDIRFMPHGLPGVETRMPAALTALVKHDAATDVTAPGLLERFVDLFAARPATINAIPGKGVIGAGYDADVVVFDPQHRRAVKSVDLHMGTDFSPFDGWELTGWPAVVVARGQVVLDDAGFHDPGIADRYLVRRGYREFRARSAAAAPAGARKAADAWR